MRNDCSKGTAFTLAELAARTGIPARTIRFYISRGLLPRPRGAGRSAVYGEEHLRRIEKIRELKARGLTLAEIGEASGFRPAAARLPRASALLSYPVSDDVVVLVRSGTSPWRLRRIREALAGLASALAEETEKTGDDEAGLAEGKSAKRIPGGERA